MLTGKRLFSGETASETLASVIKDAPDWNHLPADTPSRIRQLLRRCLNKDPKERLRDIGEARIAIDRPEEEDVATLATSASWWRRALPWGVTVAVAALALWAPWRPDSEPKRPVRLSAAIGADASLAFGNGPAAVLSPDGSMLAFVAREGEAGTTQLFVRRLDQTQASALSGTEGARNPFFSSDGQWIGFFASGKLKKIAVVGGAAVTLADAGSDRGGSWSEDGTIVFTPNNRDPLLRVSSAGGTPEPLTTLDEEESEVSHRWPQVLPGGKAVLFTASALGNNYEEAHFVVQALASGERKIVHRGGFHARYLLSGHLAYVHEGTLFVTPFDLDRLEMTGAPAPLLENVTASALRGAAQYAVSGDGTLCMCRARPV